MPGKVRPRLAQMGRAKKKINQAKLIGELSNSVTTAQKQSSRTSAQCDIMWWSA